MKETFQSMWAGDFRQRYQGSFGFYKTDSGKQLLVLMTNVADNVAMFVDDKKAVYRAYADEGVEFEFIPVKKRLFVQDDRLMLILRRPARMWARGVNEANTTIRYVPGGTTQLNFERVKAALVDEPPPFLEMFRNWTEKKRKSLLLSDQFGMDAVTLFLYGEPIGEFKELTKELVVKTPLFQQEVKDVLARREIDWRVV